MNATPASASESLVLLIAEPPAAPPTFPPDSQDQVQEEGLTLPFGTLARRVSRKPVDLAKLREDLDRIEGEVGALLKDRADSKVAGMRLDEIQVSLGISAEGSIGVVTAGVTASITLVYARTRQTTGGGGGDRRAARRSPAGD